MKPFLVCFFWLWLLTGCAAIDLAQIGRPVTLALRDPSPTRLAKQHSAAIAAHPGESGFSLIDSGLQALAVRLDLTDQAQKTLDLQYYILRSDLSGLLLIEHLLAAADRGVRVRILVDDLHFARDDEALLALDTHPNVAIRLINPFLKRHSPGRMLEAVTDFDRVQRRMHNKVFIADNTVAVVGGRNLGDEYFEAHPRLDLRDIDLRAIGPVVRQLSISFDSYWNYRQILPVSASPREIPDRMPLQALRKLLNNHRQRTEVTRYRRRLDNFRNAVMPAIWAQGKLLADFPCKLNPEQPACTQLSFDRFYELFGKARSELLIISPYFVPGRQGIDLFRELRHRGVKSKVLTNSYAATDLKIVQAGYNRYRRALLQEQVDLFEFKPTSPPPLPKSRDHAGFTGASQACMHAKAYVMDRRLAFIGSFNHDPRSATFNTEVGILIDSPELAAQLVALFERYTNPQNSYRLQLKQGKGKTGKLVWHTEENGMGKDFHQEPMVGWWQHLKSALLGILAPEGLL